MDAENIEAWTELHAAVGLLATICWGCAFLKTTYDIRTGAIAPSGGTAIPGRFNLGRLIGRTKGGTITKLHAVTDANVRPLSIFITVGLVSDYAGAAALLDDSPKAKWMLAERGCDADW
jgi:hypothetical protein